MEHFEVVSPDTPHHLTFKNIQ